MFIRGGKRMNETNRLDAGRQCGVQEQRLAAKGLLEPEERLGLALPKTCPLAFLTTMT